MILKQAEYNYSKYLWIYRIFKQESIDTILEMSKYKEKYNCKVLIATGCLNTKIW